MKRIISLLLAVVMMISMTTTSFAANTGEEYYTVQVEYSDNIGHREELDVMILNNNVFVDAKMLAERLGYTFGENGEGAVVFNKDTSNGLPFGITQFKYNSTQVSHMLFNNMIDTYEAPFASVKNNEGSWIPLEYSLLLINSGMMITDDALLIDIPTKRIIDYFYDIAKNSEKYNFDWADDFGYTETDLKVLGGSSHLINVFNGLLGFDGASWATLFQQFAGSMASYDKKYGENLSMLLCTESDKELQSTIDKVDMLIDVLDEDGKLGQMLSSTSAMLDSQVGTLYKNCEDILQKVKSGNSSLVSYNRSYQALENALDRQTWFSNTGGNILEVQKGVSNAAGKAFTFLDVGTKVLEVVGYAQEFQNQDKFSLAALTYYLGNETGGLELPEAMKKSMIDYSDALSSSIGEYTTKRFDENVDQWIIDEIPMHEVLGTQAAAVLFAWNIASNTIPFIANGLSGADSFELALYSLVFQGDAFLNYLSKRDSVFADSGKITAENMYDIAQYCYIYLKSCYTTREAALASLANKSSSTKEKIQPLIDYQNSINAEIAKIMVELKGANKVNDGCVFGFLPSDNEDYLGKYDDSQLISWIKEPKKTVEKIELTSDIYHDTTQGMAYEYAIITAYSDVGDIVWSYETPKYMMTEMTAVVELGQKGNYYYLVENTSVVCIDVQSGTILWKNADYAGRASGFAFGESAIYLCGQYGPDFYAISYTGETLVRIDQFDPNYYWATEIELQEERAAVYLHGGTSDYDDPKIFYVDLNTYSVTSELDKIATDSPNNEIAIYTQYLLAGGYSELMGYEVGKEYLEVSTCLVDIDNDDIDELLISLMDTEFSGPRGYQTFTALLDIQDNVVKTIDSAYYGGGTMGGDYLVLKYDQKDLKYVLALDGIVRDSIYANSIYLHIYSDNIQEVEWDIVSNYYNLSLDTYAEAADRIRSETSLFFVNGDDFKFYEINNEYVSEDEYSTIIERFIDPVDTKYQMQLGTYLAPISIK